MKRPYPPLPDEHDPLCRLSDRMWSGNCECPTIRRVRATDRGEVSVGDLASTRVLLERLRGRIDLLLVSIAEIEAAERAVSDIAREVVG